MAGKFTDLQKSYRIMDADGVSLYRIVTYGDNDNECKKPAIDNLVPLGIVDNDERIVDPLRGAGEGDQSGKQVAVKLNGIGNVALIGNVSYGDRVIAAEGGYVKRMPDSPAIKEITTIEVTAGCTTSGNLTVTLDGNPNTVAVLDTDDTAAKVATKVGAVIDALTGYSATVEEAVVTVTASAGGAEVDATFDGGTTGVTAEVAVAVQGADKEVGTWNVIGFAEKAGVDGDVIPVRMAFHVITIAE